jgi:hypothetical protein
LALRAAAAWYKLTFIAENCGAANMPVSQDAHLQYVTHFAGIEIGKSCSVNREEIACSEANEFCFYG